MRWRRRIRNINTWLPSLLSEFSIPSYLMQTILIKHFFGFLQLWMFMQIRWLRFHSLSMLFWKLISLILSFFPLITHVFSNRRSIFATFRMPGFSLISLRWFCIHQIILHLLAFFILWLSISNIKMSFQVPKLVLLFRPKRVMYVKYKEILNQMIQSNLHPLLCNTIFLQIRI